MTWESEPEVDADALAAMRTAGDLALPKETGGILLGFRSDVGVHITGVIEVPDPRATRNRYQRSHRRATTLLSAALTGQPSDSPIGYVGEWHTHPAPVGPSGVDLGALAATALAAADQITLVVLAREDEEWRPIVTIAEPQPPRPRTIKKTRRRPRKQSDDT